MVQGWASKGVWEELSAVYDMLPNFCHSRGVSIILQSAGIFVTEQHQIQLLCVYEINSFFLASPSLLA
jgi:hypothetical protein